MYANASRGWFLLPALIFASLGRCCAGEETPTLFIVGDSTVRTGTRGQMGWGDPLAKLFDRSKINVQNHAIGGRSSRTFQTEGRWDKILALARPGILC
jgi:lysophospholipase L1-like esterase